MQRSEVLDSLGLAGEYPGFMRRFQIAILNVIFPIHGQASKYRILGGQRCTETFPVRAVLGHADTNLEHNHTLPTVHTRS